MRCARPLPVPSERSSSPMPSRCWRGPAPYGAWSTRARCSTWARPPAGSPRTSAWRVTTRRCGPWFVRRLRRHPHERAAPRVGRRDLRRDGADRCGGGRHLAHRVRLARATHPGAGQLPVVHAVRPDADAVFHRDTRGVDQPQHDHELRPHPDRVRRDSGDRGCHAVADRLQPGASELPDAAAAAVIDTDADAVTARDHLDVDEDVIDRVALAWAGDRVVARRRRDPGGAAREPRATRGCEPALGPVRSGRPTASVPAMSSGIASHPRQAAAGRAKSCTGVTALVDTNVLVYRFDARYPEKQGLATALLRSGVVDASVVLAH